MAKTFNKLAKQTMTPAVRKRAEQRADASLAQMQDMSRWENIFHYAAERNAKVCDRHICFFFPAITKKEKQAGQNHISVERSREFLHFARAAGFIAEYGSCGPKGEWNRRQS